MNLSELTSAFENLFSPQSLNDANRPMRLRLAARHGVLDRALLIQRIDIDESLCGGLAGHVTCLSTRTNLPLRHFNALPLEVQLVTDRGGLRRICGLVAHTPWPV